MSNRFYGATLLIAGTCIGSGIIALPLVLVKLGVMPSVLLMLIIWFTVHYSSLVNIELHLNCKGNLAPGELGRHFSGPIAGFIGDACLWLLHYSLLAAYIHGGGSIIREFCSGTCMEGMRVYVACATALAAMLVLPIKLVDYLNRIFFFALIGIVMVLFNGLTWGTKIATELPVTYKQLDSWLLAVPVLFTSFGFHGSIHSVASYCLKHKDTLRKASLFGTLIPVLVYASWVTGILSSIYLKDQSLYNSIIGGQVEAGELVGHLTKTSGNAQTTRAAIWAVSLLAIWTSMIGVGIGLLDSVKGYLSKLVPQKTSRRFVSVFLVVLPPLLIAMFIPNAFVNVLGFAGMILVVMAVLLPLYLYAKAGITSHYAILKMPLCRIILAAIGTLVIVCELLHLIKLGT